MKTFFRRLWFAYHAARIFFREIRFQQRYESSDGIVLFDSLDILREEAYTSCQKLLDEINAEAKQAEQT